MITDPPKVIPLFAGRVESIPVSASIGDAVQMMHQKGYSQIPTYRGETFVGLLTANTIARWLGSSVQDELVSLAETSVERVLTFAEDSDNFRFTSRGGSIFDVIGIFESYLLGGKRLEAILITHAGKPSETPLGIITIWDLPKIYEQVGIAPR
jgi:predicted transcriptional regulator